MKGLLHKSEQRWLVGPIDNMAGTIYPLHPKDEEMIESMFTAKFTRDINFEIVKEYIDEHTNQVQSYAKLI